MDSDLDAFDIFLDLEADEEEIPPEPHTEDILATKNCKVEMSMNQQELVIARLEKLSATEAEQTACYLGALSVLEYEHTGTMKVVDNERKTSRVKTAMAIIEEVCPQDTQRQVRLLNVVIPWARHLKAEYGWPQVKLDSKLPQLYLGGPLAMQHPSR